MGNEITGKQWKSQYIWLMRLLGLIYLGGGLLFFFFPSQIFYAINIIARIVPVVEAVPESSEFFWLVLATSMMLMLSFLSFLSSAYPDIKGYAGVHILSKLASSAGFLYLFLTHKKYFAYALGIATDLPIAFLVAFATIRISKALKKEKETA